MLYGPYRCALQANELYRIKSIGARKVGGHNADKVTNFFQLTTGDAKISCVKLLEKLYAKNGFVRQCFNISDVDYLMRCCELSTESSSGSGKSYQLTVHHKQTLVIKNKKQG